MDEILGVDVLDAANLQGTGETKIYKSVRLRNREHKLF